MDGLFFVRIMLPPDSERGNPGLPDMVIASQLFTNIHRSAHGSKFAISLPGLVERSDDGEATIGMTVQIFCSNKQDLQKILDSTSVRRLLRDTCTVTPVRPVLPTMIQGWESYVRDRSGDKTSPSALRRAQRRLEEGKCTVNRASVGSLPDRRPAHLPYFVHTSLTTAQEGQDTRPDRYFVKRVSATKPARFSFDSFGLSRSGERGKVAHNGAVPVLRNTSRG
jgi:CRISPR-associated endoribonuclease Cas6/Csy4 subtype I-F